MSPPVECLYKGNYIYGVESNNSGYNTLSSTYNNKFYNSNCSTYNCQSYNTNPTNPYSRPGIANALHDPELKPTYYIGIPCSKN